MSDLSEYQIEVTARLFITYPCLATQDKRSPDEEQDTNILFGFVNETEVRHYICSEAKLYLLLYIAKSSEKQLLILIHFQ